MADAKQALPPKEVEVPTTTEGLRALVKRAQAGDDTTRPVLRKMVENPYYVRILGGELAETAVNSFVRGMCETDLSFAEAVRKKLELMRADLLGENPTPVERLLVERIAACWLQVQDAEIRYAQNQNNLTVKNGDYFQRRIDAASRRFLAAVKALAVVRRLAVPALQINLASKQVNVVARRDEAARIVNAEVGRRCPQDNQLPGSLGSGHPDSVVAQYS